MTYTIPVNFTITYNVSVRARNEAFAKEKAEEEASKMFEADLNEGMLGTFDFTYEAQDPV